MSRYTLVLRACSVEGRPHVSQFLGKAFSLKESTCATIAASAPIALLADLSEEQAAVCQVLLAGLHHAGVTFEYLSDAAADLPKIDWPRLPPIFKRDLDDHVSDYGGMALACPDCSGAHSLLALMVHRLGSRGPGSTTSVYAPQAATASNHEIGATTGARPATTAAREFKGAHLPEITPFSTPILPSGGMPGTRPAARREPSGPVRVADGESADAVSRLNELFPDDDGGGQFMPDNNDITSILNRLLPDEDPNNSRAGTASSSRLTALPSSGYSLFLAKITDNARREKAVPLIAEMANVSAEEAEILSKKVIIPVLKGTTKDECEAGKQRFAKLGVLARIKGAGER